MKDKKTSDDIASKAGQILGDDNSSKIAKTLAASALSQVDKSKKTGSDVEEKAAKALQSNKYSKQTKSMAGSVLSQSDKTR
jgi:hypothetical protein